MTDSLLKVFLGPLIVTIAGGWILYASQQAPAPKIVAEMNWADTPSPFAHIDAKKFAKDLVGAKGDMTAVSSFAAALEKYVQIRIVTITVTNRSDVSSKAVEVIDGSEGVFLYFDRERVPRLVTRVVLPSLLPQEAVSITAFKRPSLSDWEDGALILHDGKKVHPEFLRVDEHLKFLQSSLGSYSPFAYPMLIGSFLVMIVTAFAVAINMYVAGNPARRFWVTSRQEIKEQIAFVDYVRAHHPSLTGDQVQTSPSGKGVE